MTPPSGHRRIEPGAVGGVIFDLDGTLYSAGPMFKLRVALRMWHWRDLGILRHVGLAREHVRGRDFDDGRALDGAFFEALAARARIDPGEAARWYEDRFMAVFIRGLERGCAARPGLLDLLGAMRGRGILLAVLSDYGKVPERLDALRIPRSAFDLIASAGDSGSLKPSPRSLLSIADRWRLPPGRVLVVGDRDDMDGAGARAAGMQHLILDRGPDPLAPLRALVSRQADPITRSVL